MPDPAHSARLRIAARMLALLDGILGMEATTEAIDLLTERMWRALAAESKHHSGIPSQETRETVRALAQARRKSA